MSTQVFVPSKSAKNSNGLVQTFFDWDAHVEVYQPKLDEVTELRSAIAAKNKQQSLDFGPSTTQHHRSSEPARSRTVAKKNAPRRGRDEHIGVALVSVLGKYGISVDDLLNEIERQKKEGAQ